MMKLVILLAVAALAAAAPAGAGNGMGGMQPDTASRADTAKALSLQALAILAEGRGHEQAVEKLDRALATGGKGDIDLQAIRAAHAALHQEDTAAARRLLEHAFPGKESHLVGVTYRPRLGGAELAAGIAAVALLLAGAAGLAHRRRLERATHRSEHAVG